MQVTSSLVWLESMRLTRHWNLCTAGGAAGSCARSQPMVSTGAVRPARISWMLAYTSSQPAGASELYSTFTDLRAFFRDGLAASVSSLISASSTALAPAGLVCVTLPPPAPSTPGLEK